MKKTFITASLVVLSLATFAQQKKSAASAKKPTSSHSSKASVSTAQPSWGIGLRAGNLTGLSVKKYLGKSALEFSLGTLYTYGYNYNKRFKDDYQYVSYYGRNRGLGIQLHYMGQKAIKGAPGLDWYYGGGLQVRFDRTSYTYRYKSYYGNGKNDYVWVQTTDRPGFADVGLDGLIGLEYKFKEVPLALFVDTNLYIELVHTPGWVNMQGGLGLRYNF